MNVRKEEHQKQQENRKRAIWLVKPSLPFNMVMADLSQVSTPHVCQIHKAFNCPIFQKTIPPVSQPPKTFEVADTEDSYPSQFEMSGPCHLIMALHSRLSHKWKHNIYPVMPSQYLIYFDKITHHSSCLQKIQIRLSQLFTTGQLSHPKHQPAETILDSLYSSLFALK